MGNIKFGRIEIHTAPFRNRPEYLVAFDRGGANLSAWCRPQADTRSQVGTLDRLLWQIADHLMANPPGVPLALWAVCDWFFRLRTAGRIDTVKDMMIKQADAFPAQTDVERLKSRVRELEALAARMDAELREKTQALFTLEQKSRQAAVPDDLQRIVADAASGACRAFIGQKQPAVREGWEPVPVEPTREMLIDGAKAARDWLSGNGQYPRTRAVYRAMLAAAPKPECDIAGCKHIREDQQP